MYSRTPSTSRPSSGPSPQPAAPSSSRSQLRQLPYDEQVRALTPASGATQASGEKGAEAKPASDQSVAGGLHTRPTAQIEEGTAKPTHDAIRDPMAHPYWPTFLARVEAVFASGHLGAPPREPAEIAAEIWRGICSAMLAAQPSMDDPAAYSDWEKRFLDTSSPQFQNAMAQFRAISAQMVGVASSQFNSARSFGLWTKPDGRMLAEQVCDLTLESSAVGGLFDGLPTLSASTAGFDMDLWAGLSDAYASAIAAQCEDEDKRIHVCVGAYANPQGVWNTIERRALQKGLAELGYTLRERVTYHAAAATTKERAALDPGKQVGEFQGTVYSGPEPERAMQAASAHFDTLPER